VGIARIAARPMMTTTRTSITIVITIMQVKIQGFQFIWLLEESLRGLGGTFQFMTLPESLFPVLNRTL
jgi:hypothetical protein